MYARHLYRDLAQFNRILDNVVVECSQRPRHIKDVIKMVPVVPLSRAKHLKGKTDSLSKIKTGQKSNG